MKRIISAILGVGLIGLVIYFGIRSGSDNRFVVPFGLFSALVAPVGISALGYSIRKEDNTLQKLALVPEIDNLIEKAETEAEKITRLKKEKEELLNYIKNETKRIAKVERKKILEADARKLLDEYDKVLEELKEMDKGSIDIHNISSEIKELYEIKGLTEKKQNGLNISICGMEYVVESLFGLYSLPAEIIVEVTNNLVMLVFEAIQEFVHILFKREK